MKKIFKSNIKGAVFVARHSEDYEIKTWTANQGITKRHGCVWFDTGKGCASGDYTYISQFSCRRRYNDCPEQGTAWLVHPCKNGKDCWWEPVDHLIDFS